MKCFVVIVALAVIAQTANSQCLRSQLLSSPVVSPLISAYPSISAPLVSSVPAPIFSQIPAPIVPSCGCGQAYPNIVNTFPQLTYASDSVANNLADTLSLLTVSSLLADTLPYGGCGCAPLGVAPVLSNVVAGCGCGGGCAGGCGYYF